VPVPVSLPRAVPARAGTDRRRGLSQRVLLRPLTDRSMARRGARASAVAVVVIAEQQAVKRMGPWRRARFVPNHRQGRPAIWSPRYGASAAGALDLRMRAHPPQVGTRLEGRSAFMLVAQGIDSRAAAVQERRSATAPHPSLERSRRVPVPVSLPRGVTVRAGADRRRGLSKRILVRPLADRSGSETASQSGSLSCERVLRRDRCPHAYGTAYPCSCARETQGNKEAELRRGGAPAVCI
jgi:hypothetical protein